MSTILTAALTSSSKKQAVLSVSAALVAFMAYTAVYGYRKPFTVATFHGLSFWGIKYQTLLIISQGLGYMVSKFGGIRFIAELKRPDRWKLSAVFIGISWLCLLVLAIVPAPWGMPCMFANGAMLGLMWGIIFSYVEGRRATDFIAAVLAVSFIFAGGFTRSVALWLHENWHIQQQWLAFVTGLVFVLPLALCIYLLEKMPPPDENDRQERTVRQPMMQIERNKFLQLFGGGILAVTITYLFLTIMRDLRDNFMVNIWNELGYGARPAVFTYTETITSLVVLLLMSMMVFLRHHMRVLRLVHVVVITGFLLAGIASALFLTGFMHGVLWMQLAGLGLYMGYVPFNCIFFERLIASFKIAGNVGFLIYWVDAYGYLGSSVIVLWKEIGQVKLTWIQFYPAAVVVFSVVGAMTTLFSLIYFNKKHKRVYSL